MHAKDPAENFPWYFKEVNQIKLLAWLKMTVS